MKLTLNEDFFEPALIVEPVETVIEQPIPDVVSEIPKIKDETPSGPETGVDNGIANQIIEMINGEWDTIKLYNDLVTNLTQYGFIDFIPVIQDILNEENIHVGQLHAILQKISPNAESIEQGEIEAETEQLSEGIDENMKIVKEDLYNLEKVKDRKTTQGIMMKNAEQESNAAEENFKEVAGDPMELKEKEPFLGAEKQETPKKVETPKPELEESLFESITDYFIGEDKLMYQLLDRMKSDCEYVINEGSKGAFKYLYSGSVDEQISDMMDLYNYLVNKNGPIEWIDENDIAEYEKKLHDIEMNESLKEDVNVNDVNVTKIYTIVEEALDNAMDNIANVIANRISDYDVDWCADEPSQKTTLLQSEYIEAIVNDLFKNRNYNESLMNEAGGLKDGGVLYSTDGEPFTFWDKIYAELDGNLHPQENDYIKLSELPVKNRKDKYQEISVDPEGNIRVFAPTRDKLEHAINVAKYYDLEYKAGTSIGYKDPEKAFYCTIYIPQDEQELPVEYDAREEKYKNRKTYSQRQKEKEEKKLAKKRNKNV